MCKTMTELGSCTDPTCRFAHNEAQLRATHGFFKMKMCGFAQSGRCKNGDACRFAHSREELRPAKPMPVGVEDEALMARRDPRLMQQHATQSQPSVARGQGAASVPGNIPARGGGAAGAASQEFNMNNFIFGKQGNTDVPPPHEPSNEHSKFKDNEQHRRRRQTNQPLRSGRAPNLNGANSSYRSTTDIDAGGGVSGTQNENDSADASSWASGSSATELPRSEHTGSHPTTSDSSSTNNVHTTGATSSAGGTASSNPVSEQRIKRKTQKPPKEAVATTLLVINVPTYLTQGALLSMMEDLTQSMRGNYDFYYCPWNEVEGRNMGYAILNFPDPNQALDFQQHWTNRFICRGSRERPVRVLRASVQGLEANLEYFSKVEISACSDLRFRPLYRDANSILQPLPLDMSSRSAEQLVQPTPTFSAQAGVAVAGQETFQGRSEDFSFGQPSHTLVHDSRSSRSALQSAADMRRVVGFNGARQTQGRQKRHGYPRSAMPQQFPTSAAARGDDGPLPQGFPCSAGAEPCNTAMQSAAGFTGAFNTGVGGKEEYLMAPSPDTAAATTDCDAAAAAAAAGNPAQQVLTWPMMMTPVPWPMGPLVGAQGQRAAMSTEDGSCRDSPQNHYLVGANNCASPRTTTQSGDYNPEDPRKTQQVLYHQHMAPYMMTMMPMGGNSRQMEQSSMSPMMPNMWVNTDEVYMD
jgi:hypothetical protein